jgi:hypothetical protein
VGFVECAVTSWYPQRGTYPRGHTPGPEAPSAAQTTPATAASGHMRGMGTLPQPTRTSAAWCRYLKSELRLTARSLRRWSGCGAPAPASMRRQSARIRKTIGSSELNKTNRAVCARGPRGFTRGNYRLSSVRRRDRASLRRLRSGSKRATGAGLLWVSQADEDDAESAVRVGLEDGRWFAPTGARQKVDGTARPGTPVAVCADRRPR